MKALRPGLGNNLRAAANRLLSELAPALGNTAVARYTIQTPPSGQQTTSVRLRSPARGTIHHDAPYMYSPPSEIPRTVNKSTIRASTALGPMAKTAQISPGQSPTRRAIHQDAPYMYSIPTDTPLRMRDDSRLFEDASTIPGKSDGKAVPAAAIEPMVHDVFEPLTGTWQYVVADPITLRAAIIDPVLDFDPATGVVTTQTADALLSLVGEKGYTVDWILETHAHADHLTAAPYLRSRLSKETAAGLPHKPTIGIGKRIGGVQNLFGQRYGIPAEELVGGFDKLFDDDEVFHIGEMAAAAMHLPGHTPDHLGYKIGDNVFCGDLIFNTDIGTARCDFPGGSAESLFKSSRRLLTLPDHVKIWTGHDYPSLASRAEPVACMTVKEHRERNKHLGGGITLEEFVSLRKARDATLGAPRLLHQSLQMNVRAGRLPKPMKNGERMLYNALKVKGEEW